MMTTVDERAAGLLAAQFERLADCLEQGGPGLATQPSLCAGWTAANVMAHITQACRYDPPTFQRLLAAVGYDFDTLSNQIAAQDGGLPFDRLLADLRSTTMATWAPPGGGPMGALTHVVIHGLDITAATGLPRTADDAATALVLQALTEGRLAERFGRSTDGLRVRANDLDFDYGTGPLVDAPAGELILALSGRPRPGASFPSKPAPTTSPV